MPKGFLIMVRKYIPILLVFWFVLFFILQISLHAEPSIELKKRIHQIFPGQNTIGDKESDFPVYPVYHFQDLIGYAFVSTDLGNFPSFSGEPITLLTGIDIEGQYKGIHLLDHSEPIFLHGLGEEPFLKFLVNYLEHPVSERFSLSTHNSGSSAGATAIDGISGATVTMMIVNEIVQKTALQVAREKIAQYAQKNIAVPKSDLYETMSWEQLINENLIKNLSHTKREVAASFGHNLFMESANSDRNKKFIDTYYAYLNVPMIGKNILGPLDFKRLMTVLKKGEHALIMISKGTYKHVAKDFVSGTVSDRILVTQKGLPLEIRDLDFILDKNQLDQHKLPSGSMIHIFKIDSSSNFDPSAELSLSLSVATNPLYHLRDSIQFDSIYKLDPKYFDITEKESPPPFWISIWKNRIYEVILLISFLSILTLAFVLQNRISKNRVFFTGFKWSYLTFTILFIGVYTQGQLSVVNIFTILRSVLNGFDLTMFLLDPILSILLLYTLLTLILWGRGIFCGWLCPFGALQDFLSLIANKMKIPQRSFSQFVHQKLLYLKYVLLVVLVTVSFYSLSMAEMLSEIEPFKTVVSMRFDRSLPFVSYAILTLALGLILHKFFCRYLCPLGAGLAILGKFKILDNVSRLSRCGAPCRLCNKRCQIDAITADGQINYDECTQCLDCIVILNDDKQCTEKILEIKRLEKPLPV
ncbi:MAG: 4Fe-4S binding protein [Proteobacteria bacterium]|nr:4Fe-4S binding protein [Pseudomonadota bacterium]